MLTNAVGLTYVPNIRLMLDGKPYFSKTLIPYNDR